MEHLGLTTASTRSDSSRKLPPRCDLSSTFSIIFPVQVAVWGYWKCSSSEFSVDRVHHSYRFSFGGVPISHPFFGGLKRWNIPSMVWSTQGYPFHSGAWNWIPTSWMGLHRHRTSDPWWDSETAQWQETMGTIHFLWEQSMANIGKSSCKAYFWGSHLSSEGFWDGDVKQTWAFSAWKSLW